MATDPELEARARGAPSETGEDASRENLLHDMTQALRRLEAHTRGVFGSAVIDAKGFPIAWDLKGGTQQASVGLIGATLRAQLNRSASILDLGLFSSGLVKFDKGLFGVFEIGTDDLFLVLLAGSQANVMDLLLETDAVLRELRDILGRP